MHGPSIIHLTDNAGFFSAFNRLNKAPKHEKSENNPLKVKTFIQKSRPYKILLRKATQLVDF